MKRYESLFILAAVAPFLSGCGTDGEAEEAPTLVTAAVERGDLLISAEATGTVEPIRDVEVKSKASGEILKLHVDVGDYVEPGALLAEIDPRDVRNGFEQAEADLGVARARMEISKAQLDRSTELLEAGVITQQDFETRNLDYANAQAQLVRSETNYELAQLRLEDVRIRAPLAGTVIQRNVEEGTVIQSASQNVSGGTTLMTMANLAEMQVRTLVDETDMGEIRAGMAATVTVEAFPDRVFVGEVLKVEPQAVVQQNVTMFPVIVALDNQRGLLKPGMNAEVEIEIAQANDVILVPNNAVVQMQNAGAAAMVLGMNVEELDFSSLMRRGRGGAQANGERPVADDGGSEGPETASEVSRGEGTPSVGARRAVMDSLVAKVEVGEITRDSMMTVMRARFGQARDAQDATARRAGGRQGFAGGRRSSGGAGGGDADQGGRRVQTAVAFVVAADSTIEIRVITTGLNDWDYTQVLSGLEEGEQLAIVGAAQLAARQQEFLNRFRGNSLFGGNQGRGRR